MGYHSCSFLLADTRIRSPHYTNFNYPYPVDPPFVPDENPMGVYEREFEIEDVDKKTYIVFEGVSSNLELFINEKYVGFSQGSHLQSEFDISDFVKKGTNIIRVLVRKWCCFSYLEDQDFFRFNGIFRDVYLLSRPKGHIKDIQIKTEGNKVNIDFEGKASVTLLGEMKQAENKVSFEVENPVLWNAEKPYLYTLTFKYEDEIIEMKFGFKTIEISKKGEFLVNGVPVKLKGVNHHDTDGFKGWYQTYDDMRNDLLLMKKLNINTVRTSHYPPPPELLLSWTPEQLDYMHDAQYWMNMVSQCGGAEVIAVSEMESNDEVWADWLKQENEYAIGDRKSMEAGGGKYLNFIKIVLRKK